MRIEINKGCVYWYEISMHVNKKGDGYYEPAKVRVPVTCISANTDSSIIKYLNPASSQIETKAVKNDRLFDSPLIN